MDNIKTILASLALTMAVGMPAVASDELTMVVGTSIPTRVLLMECMFIVSTNERGSRNWWAMCRLATLRFS